MLSHCNSNASTPNTHLHENQQGKNNFPERRKEGNAQTIRLLKYDISSMVTSTKESPLWRIGVNKHLIYTMVRSTGSLGRHQLPYEGYRKRYMCCIRALNIPHVSTG